MPEITIPHVSDEPTKVTGGANRFEFEWAEMYSPPSLSYKILRDLVEFFGTEEIDTSDTISEDWCETCDFGSKYGFCVVIEHATRNNPFRESNAKTSGPTDGTAGTIGVDGSAAARPNHARTDPTRPIFSVLRAATAPVEEKPGA